MRIPRPVLASLLALPLTLSLTGCISSYTLVKVKPDGTGTVEQTTLISPMMINMMAGMAAGMSGEKDSKSKSKPPSMADMFKEDELRAAAAKMGTGVRFVSATPAKADGKEGVTAIYAFDDITKISVTQGMKAPGSDGPGPGVSNDSPIAFTLAPQAGGSKLLSITMPDRDKPEAKTKSAKKSGGPDMNDMPPEALAMVKAMFQGAKIGVDVEVAGKLIRSNSPYVNGSRVTLMEVDLGALMEDPTKFEKLQELGPGASFDEARKVLGDVKGIKLPPSRITTIEWR